MDWRTRHEKVVIIKPLLCVCAQTDAFVAPSPSPEEDDTERNAFTRTYHKKKRQRVRKRAGKSTSLRHGRTVSDANRTRNVARCAVGLQDVASTTAQMMHLFSK